MKVSILIVTHERDFPWLRWCLRSIAKYAKGFEEVVVCLPSHDPWNSVMNFATGYTGQPFLRFRCFDEWPDKGFVHHMERILHADEICTDADFILHMDADCIFVDHVTPDDYFVDGKPVLIGAPYDWIVQKFNNSYHYCWQTAVENAIGGKPEREWMRRHPAVHHAAVYPAARKLIAEHTGQPVSDYIRSTQNTFPHGFAEFPTLGEVAWRHFRDRYHWLRQETDPWPKDKLWQFWSHGPLDQTQNVWNGGTLHEMNPIKVFEKYL